MGSGVSGQFTDAGTFNTANELTPRSLTGGVMATFTTTHDAVGSTTNLSGDDGKDSKDEHDAFGRMVRVRSGSTDALVAEDTSRGLGFGTRWEHDADASGAVDGSDALCWFAHGGCRRVVAGEGGWWWGCGGV